MARFSKRVAEVPPQSLSFHLCPAKTTEADAPGLSVEEHCRIVGSVARGLLNQTSGLTRNLLPAGCLTIAASHDLGKVSPGFVQKYFLEWLASEHPEVASDLGPFNENHAEISEAALRTWAKLHNHGEAWRVWSQVLGAHHGKRTAEASAEPCYQYGLASWMDERLKLLEVLIREFGPLPPLPPSFESLRLSAGLTTVADWIGSNEDWFPQEGLPHGANYTEHADTAIKEAGFSIPRIRPGLSFSDLFPGIPSPNEMQTVFHELTARPGLYVLEAPMGVGKTEAALYAAYRLMAAGLHNGLYFALPTRLTSNRLHTRVAAFLDRAFEGQAGARLVHGQAWIAAQQPGGEELRPGGAWFAPSKRALLYPFGVGTIDQALLAVMNVRHGFVRAFGLSGKVVILDEVHSYDVYTGTLLNSLVEWLLRLGCTVMILSATLTRQRRDELLCVDDDASASAYPLISFRVDGDVQTREVSPPPPKAIRCSYAPDDMHQLAERAGRLASDGQCVLWICNTVARSQTAFGLVKSAAMEGTSVGLLHSRFPAWRRNALEETWLSRLGKDGERPKGCVLVATQVVEQSVDIDSDVLISDLAPTDMLLQRMGRLWRHERKGRIGEPICLITGGDFANADCLRELKDRMGPSRFVYSPYVLWRSYGIWHNRPEVVLPDHIRDLLEKTYTSPTECDPPWVKEDLYTKLETDRAKLGQLAMSMTRDDLPTRSDDDDAASTRYNDRPMVSVLLVRSCDERSNTRAKLQVASGERVELIWDPATRRNMWAAAQVHRNLVSLPKHPDFSDIGRSGPRWMQSVVYGAVVVLKINERGDLVRLGGESTRYAYNDERGVWKREDPVELMDVSEPWEDFNESDW